MSERVRANHEPPGGSDSKRRCTRANHECARWQGLQNVRESEGQSRVCQVAGTPKCERHEPPGGGDSKRR